MLLKYRHLLDSYTLKRWATMVQAVKTTLFLQCIYTKTTVESSLYFQAM